MAGIEDENIKKAYETQPNYKDDTYLREISKNYRNYFNTTMNQAVYQQYAQRNMDAQARANGLQPASYAGTASAQMAGVMANSNANALQAYADANAKAQDSANARFASKEQDLANFMGEQTSQADLDSLMARNGYSKNADGVWYTADGVRASDYVNNLYNEQVKGYGSAGQMSLEDVGSLRFKKLDGTMSVKDIKDKFDKAFGVVEDMNKKGEIEAGTVIKLGKNGSDQKAYITKNANGTWSYVSEEEFKNSQKKLTIKGRQIL